MIPLTKADRPAITAFLRAHIATSMFPLANLRNYGMAGDHPRALRIWGQWQAGALTDVLAVSEEGVVFPQCPTSPWGVVKAIMAGMTVKGILGEGTQVAGLRKALGLPPSTGVDVEEPLYHLPLHDLVMPDCAGFSLRPLSDAPRDLITRWRADYIAEGLQMPGEDPLVQAASDVECYLAKGSHRVLMQGEVPVAMTGFNATLPEAVQVGGVYTPPPARSQGLARRAVALHLTEARASGATTAILFAASPEACKAYEAIGFTRIGSYHMCLYPEPQLVHV
ncbi:MAG: GNAT family N-acetyltransferase [Pseudomonadota bacterium]